jgi:hypothetical protein
MGPFSPSVAWLIRTFHFVTILSIAAFLSYTIEDFQFLAKGKLRVSAIKP